MTAIFVIKAVVGMLCCVLAFILADTIKSMAQEVAADVVIWWTDREGQ
jgi:hypothetical protein